VLQNKKKWGAYLSKKKGHNSARILASLSTFCTSSIEKRATSVVMMFSKGKRQKAVPKQY